MASDVLMKGDPVPFVRSMGRLVNCKEFSDVKFIVGDARRHIFAHRCILVSRCEVFKAMFADKVVKETNTKVPLVLSDVEPDIFMIVLEFIYTNCASLSAKTVVDVLASSIEYGLDELRKLCNAYLIRNLSVATAVETIQAAATYGQDDLRTTTLGFIEEHTAEVFKTKQFQELSEQALAVILQSSRLLMDEMDILATVKEWASVSSAVQGVPLIKAISHVIQHVRFPLLNEAELQKVESDNQAQHVIPISMIAFAWKFHALHQSDGTNLQTKLRRGTKPRDSHQGLTPWDH